MSLNWKEIELVLEELAISGSFVQNIVQPSFDALALYLYKEGRAQTLFISLASGSCRLHETRRKIPKNPKPLRFMELLKKRILGAKIVDAKQLGQERIVQLELEKNDERLFLFIRLWSGAANILLTDSDFGIIDAFYRRPKKGEISGQLFSLPLPREGEKGRDYDLRSFESLADFGLDISLLSLSEKIEKWYEFCGAQLSVESLVEKVEKHFAQKIAGIEKLLQSIEAKKEAFSNREALKIRGDLILSNAHLIEKEQKILRCLDYTTNTEIEILLDSTKNAQENANEFYKQYKKAETGFEALAIEEKKLEKEKQTLFEEKEAILLEGNPLRLEQVLRKIETPKQVAEVERPGLWFDFQDWTIIVGRNARENDELLRHYARGLDTWLHTRDVQGGFVFIKNKPGKTIPLPVLIAAGNLAVYFSKARSEARADLYYTQVKHLKRARGGKKSEKSSLTGKVLPSHEKNLFIQLDTKLLQELGL